MTCPCCGSAGPCYCSRNRAPARNMGYQPARPPRPVASQPVYRRPRSHAYSCRCPRCAEALRRSQGNAGAAGPLILVFFIVVIIGFWPAMVWHGEGGPAGTSWEWNIDSTVAELVYWGILVFIASLAAISNRVPRKAQ